MLTIHLEYSSNVVRIALRIIFTVLLLLIAMAGDRCCRNRVRRQLLKLHDVKVMDTTGWLSGVDAAVTMFSSHSSPAGYLGFFMVFTTLMWTGTDLAVSGLVTTIMLPARCNFDTSGYYSFIQSTPYNYTNNPPYVGPLYDTVTNAQLTSVANGGLPGIYQKVNTDINFRADSQDVIGSWSCEATGAETFSSSLNATQIEMELVSQKLIYPYVYGGCWQSHPDNTTGHIIIWSGSQGRNAENGGWAIPVWDVLATVDMDVVGPERPMNMYHCTMNAPTVDWVLTRMDVNDMFAQWCTPVAGSIYKNGNTPTTFLNAPERAFETVLNNIVMLSGSAWNFAELPIIEGTQGCLAPRTSVPWLVTTLLIIVIALVLGLCVYWAILLVQIISAERAGLTSEYIQTIREYTPIGMRGWMKHSIKLTGGVKHIDSRSLRYWSVGHDTKGMGIGVVRSDQGGGHVEPLVMEFTEYAPGHYDGMIFK